ncbi:MAG: hypothetical protein ACJ76I_10545 [Gaiellaceae bacterium]
MRSAAVLAAALVLTGCNGGTVDRHALTNDAGTIDSINCESWLLARADARDRVTKFYAREQAEELQIQAANLADALARRPTATGLERRVRAKGHDAATLSARLRRLHAHPTDRALAAQLATQFKAAGHCS